jgi:hypothetical protein
VSRYIKEGPGATVADLGFDSLEWLLKGLDVDRERVGLAVGLGGGAKVSGSRSYK